MVNNQVVDLKKMDADSVRVTDGKAWTTEGITEDELISSAVLFLVAGYDTTASALQFFFYSMAIYPEIQEQVRLVSLAVHFGTNMLFAILPNV